MAASVDMAPKPLAPPRAAAVAGVVFSVLLIVSLALIRWSVPTDPSETAAWLADAASRKTLGFAARAVINTAGGGDPSSLASIGCRFAKPVKLGSELRTEIWRDGCQISRTYRSQGSRAKGC